MVRIPQVSSLRSISGPVFLTWKIVTTKNLLKLTQKYCELCYVKKGLKTFKLIIKLALQALFINFKGVIFFAILHIYVNKK